MGTLIDCLRCRAVVRREDQEEIGAKMMIFVLFSFVFAATHAFPADGPLNMVALMALQMSKMQMQIQRTHRSLLMMLLMLLILLMREKNLQKEKKVEMAKHLLKERKARMEKKLKKGQKVVMRKNLQKKEKAGKKKSLLKEMKVQTRKTPQKEKKVEILKQGQMMEPQKEVMMQMEETLRPKARTGMMQLHGKE